MLKSGQKLNLIIIVNISVIGHKTYDSLIINGQKI